MQRLITAFICCEYNYHCYEFHYNYNTNTKWLDSFQVDNTCSWGPGAPVESELITTFLSLGEDDRSVPKAITCG